MPAHRRRPAVTYQHRTVATTTAGLFELATWLEAAGCTHVAMEATGVYWKPVVRHEALLDRVG